MSILKKIVKLPIETTQFFAPNPDVYHHILNLAIDNWLEKGNILHFVAKGKNLKNADYMLFDNEDIKKMFVEYVLTHGQEFKNILNCGLEESSANLKGILYRKGGKYIFKRQ